MTDELIERTPGLWEARSRLAFGDGEFAVETTEVTANDGKVIALTYGPDAEANAKLIASLPKLLAELQSQSDRIAVLEGALEPFARCPAHGKTGDRFVIAKAIYENDDYTPREAHWHWDDFERARTALIKEGRD